VRPVYTLHCRTDEGEAVRLVYKPHTSELEDQDGRPLIREAEAAVFEPVRPVSPAAPGTKSAAPKTLKIQLGMRCNYACSYCNQTTEIDTATVTKTADAGEFLRRLEGWLEGAPERIEFWGGEPFVYFAKLERLVPGLRKRFPAAELAIVTNGSLLDGEIVAFIERYDIMIAVSHDGPGQHLRGPDPFDDPQRAKWLRELWRRRRGRGRMTFNVVFTGANCDVGATYDWFARKLKDSKVALYTEGAVSVYDERTAKHSGRFSAEEYARLEGSMVEAFASGKALRYGAIADKAKDFLDSLYTRRPSSALGQKCGMDRDDHLSVDLSGRVTTCQSTGAKGKHGIGDVADISAVRLDTAWHWSHRENCNYCPVLQLCKGGCMFLEGEFFDRSCENEYHYNYAILAGVLREVTGLRLERIEGDVRRPRARKTIPLKVLAQA
jgi:uncharacterized protein